MSYFYLATALVLLFTATAAYVAQPSTQQDCKRGTGYDFQNVTDLAALRHLAWFYTWGVQAPDKASDYATEHNIEFVPMQVHYTCANLVMSWHLSAALSVYLQTCCRGIQQFVFRHTVFELLNIQHSTGERACTLLTPTVRATLA